MINENSPCRSFEHKCIVLNDNLMCKLTRKMLDSTNLQAENSSRTIPSASVRTNSIRDIIFFIFSLHRIDSNFIFSIHAN